MSGRNPTFVIAGAQRSGSTWLRNLLAAQEGVFMAEPPRPEPKFFCDESLSETDLERYRTTWFSGCAEAFAVGEKSTSYIETPGCAQRMARLLPDLKLLFVLRHPVERAVSNYRFSRAHGVETESLQTALTHEEERLRTTSFPQMSAHPFAYLRRGRYIDFLETFLAEFPRQQIRVLTFDALKADTESVLADVLTWLGVPGAVTLPHDPEKNETASDDRGELTLDRGVLQDVLAGFAPHNERLGRSFGIDVSSWADSTPRLNALLS